MSENPSLEKTILFGGMGNSGSSLLEIFTLEGPPVPLDDFEETGIKGLKMGGDPVLKDWTSDVSSKTSGDREL